MYYPIFLELQACKCLIVGAGAVGLRKLKDLQAAQAQEIVVLDPKAEPVPDCVFKQKKFAVTDLQGMSLVFAATDNFTINDYVAQACHERGIFCNIVTNPKAGNFIVPSKVSGKNILLALSTGGKSPALTKKLRQELEIWLHDYDNLAEFLGRLRPHLLDLQLGTEHNTKILRELVDSKELLAGLASQDKLRCQAELIRLMPSLGLKIEELLHGLV